MTDPQLFDPKTTVPPRCTACGATEQGDCGHDRDRDLGLISVTRRRPKACLLAYDPKTAPFPTGF